MKKLNQFRPLHSNRSMAIRMEASSFCRYNNIGG
jgi:hypothetical protein